MNDINNIPINWDDGSENKLLGSLFPKTGNSFSNITNYKKFEQNSPFKNSPFGQYWDKNIHEWAKDIYGEAKILDKNKITIADLSSKISHTQAETLNSLASKNTSKYSFVVYANPDGEQVIKMYEDPKVVPKLPFEILVFIETDDGKFDFGKIVRVKFGPEVIDDLKYKYSKELPWKDNDPKDIAEEFIKRAWSANVSSQTKQDVNQERNNSDFKDLLIKAIQYEYDNHKFDDFSWFIVFLKGAEFVGLNLPQWSFQIGHWLRTKKYKEAKYWNGDLPEKEYTPAFLPNSIFYDKADDRFKSLKEYTNLPYEQIRKEINEKISGKDILSKKLKNWLIQNIDECEKTTDEFLKKLANIYIPDGNFQTILKHYHAFEVGLFNGILEFLAGLCDLLAIIILISRNELGFRISDKLNEKFENFVIDLFYNTFELLRKIGKKLFEILVDFGKWYDTYQGKSYFIFKELGELVPDILATLIPILKGSKVAKAGTVTAKEVTEETIEEAVEKNIKELTEEEAKLISKTAKETLESGEIKEAIEKATKDVDKFVEELEDVSKNFKIDNFIERGIKNGKTIGNISKDIIVRELRNVTTTATEVSRAIDKGKIKLLKLDDVDFYNTIKNPGEKLEDIKDVLAAQIDDKIYIKNSTSLDKAFGEIVHEGKHALDYKQGLFENPKLLREESIHLVHDKVSMKSFVDKMTDNQVVELRARIAEREFQIAAKQSLDFQSVPEMISHIFKKY